MLDAIEHTIWKGNAMFTLVLFPVSPQRTLLLCQFPFACLTPFKEAVHPANRIWHPELKAWELTVSGFHDLCDAEGERLNPLPLAVLDWVYRPPPPLEAKRRRTRRTP